MDFLYCATQGDYQAGVLTIIEIVRVRDDTDIYTYGTKYEQILVMDVVAPGGALPAPWGAPTALVMDTTGDSLVVREKLEPELLLDRKKVVLGLLDVLTRKRITEVCDDDKQRTLAMLVDEMSSTQLALYTEYTSWHKSILDRHFSLEYQINAYTDIDALNVFVTDIETQYDDLMAVAPLESTKLRNYV